jgi:uncharacterized membrane-anchored protein YitT (DUF2179 family)
MIMTITLILSFLVALNFLLLIFSCNKIPKKEAFKKPTVIVQNSPTVATNQLVSNQLAPTGS